jgi:hypothetical protein
MKVYHDIINTSTTEPIQNNLLGDPHHNIENKLPRLNKDVENVVTPPTMNVDCV